MEKTTPRECRSSMLGDLHIEGSTLREREGKDAGSVQRPSGKFEHDRACHFDSAREKKSRKKGRVYGKLPGGKRRE